MHELEPADFKPIILEKEIQVDLNKKYKKLQIMMQSTSSCNFRSANALNKNKIFTYKRERNTRTKKRY